MRLSRGRVRLLAWTIFRAYGDDVVPASPPRFLQPIVFGAMVALGKLLGYRARYPEYSRAD